MNLSLVPAPVRIIGTGLIGGSLGLALRTAGVPVQVEDISPGTAALAVELGVGAAPTDGDPAPALVLVAAPPDVTATVVAEALARFPQAIVADVASVKVQAIDRLREIVPADDLTRYVGAHPMAGRELSGVIAARGDLFRGRPFVLVPHATTTPRAVAALKALATEIGSVLTVLDAETHDLAVARVSHVPQVVASALATALLPAGDDALGLAGQGLRDTTRIADSDPRLWTEILTANAPAVRAVLGEVRARLDEVDQALQSRFESASAPAGPTPRRTLAALVADGNRGVRRIPGKHGGGGDDFVTLTVLIPDRPGELARLLTEIGQENINLEDLRLEHALGRRVGLAHVAVVREAENLLTQALTARGWRVAPG